LDYGWQGQGIETGKKRAEFGQNVYGLKINTLEYHGGLVDGGLFDAITLFHVLEHLRNPKAVMEELVKSNLKDGGLLVIEVPNFGSLQSKIAGKYWLHLDPPLHAAGCRAALPARCVELALPTVWWTNTVCPASRPFRVRRSIISFRFPDGQTVSAQLWFEQGEVAYYHLSTSNEEGYRWRASYAFSARAVEYFTGRVRYLDFGGAPGLSDSGGGLPPSRGAGRPARAPAIFVAKF
jgi:SAM-dependent methyltransferase